jgi:hypothetical protein
MAASPTTTDIPADLSAVDVDPPHAARFMDNLLTNVPSLAS